MSTDPFAEIRNKRLSELTPEQRDLAHELWLRENAWTFGTYYNDRTDALFPSVFRVIDRLREQLNSRQVSTDHGPWVDSTIHQGETYCKRCFVRSVFADKRKCQPHIE